MARPKITRVSSLQVSPSSTNKNNGLYAPSLTAAQIAAEPLLSADDGGIIYNSSTDAFNLRQNGAWAALNTNPVATLTAPSAAVAPALVNGRIYYDTVTNKLTTDENGAYVAIITSPVAQGGNLVVQSANANPVPSVNGEIYYNTGTLTLRTRIDGTWVNLNTSVTTTSGDGLVAGSTSMVFPDGPKATVEVANNQVDGFTYYDTTNNILRSYVNNKWTSFNMQNRTATAANYTVLVTDVIVGVTSTAVARTITLPAVATTTPGQVFIIKDESGGATTIPIIIGRNGALIDGLANNGTIAANYGSYTVYSSGTAWFTIT